MGLDQEEMVANNRFRVAIGLAVYSFSKVSNISDTADYEAYSEGGNNSYPVLLRKPKTTMEKLVLERGVRMGEKDILMRGLTTGVPVAAVSIMIMKQQRVVKSYFFEQGIITKWELGDLDAMGKDVLIKKVEITHSGLHENVLQF